jgi:hypothetical protein
MCYGYYVILPGGQGGYLGTARLAASSGIGAKPLLGACVAAQVHSVRFIECMTMLAWAGTSQQPVCTRASCMLWSDSRCSTLTEVGWSRFLHPMQESALLPTSGGAQDKTAHACSISVPVACIIMNAACW